MICDIVVRAAQFEVVVTATRELLFQNEIYQAGQARPLSEQANFLMQDCEVHSHADAVQWVMMNTRRLESQVADTMRPVLTDMGWVITETRALGTDRWDVEMVNANGPERGDEGLVQVTRT